MNQPHEDLKVLADRNCVYCEGTGVVNTPDGDDDFSPEVCRCIMDGARRAAKKDQEMYDRYSLE